LANADDDPLRIVARDYDIKSIRDPKHTLDAVDSCFYPAPLCLLPQFLNKRLLDLSRELQISRRYHIPGIGEDRLALGKLTIVEKGSVASSNSKLNPASRAARAAAIPDTPAPTMTTSSPLPWPGLKDESPRISATARAPLSEENFSSGIPVRSPTIYRPGTLLR
jgi:hypothetical protein